MAKGLQPYWLQAYLLLYIPVGLFADSRITAVWQQYLLGALTFPALYPAALKAPKKHRRHVWVCVGAAARLETLHPVIWGIYAYRLPTVPVFVPPGSGQAAGPRWYGSATASSTGRWFCCYRSTGGAGTPSGRGSRPRSRPGQDRSAGRSRTAARTRVMRSPRPRPA